MNQKILWVILVIIIAVVMILLGYYFLREDNNSSTPTTNNSTTNEENNSNDNTMGNGDVLVVYFSASGNTEGVANIIAEELDGDLFEIEPLDPYTADDLDWTDDNARVTLEHEDESLRDVELVTTTPSNWDNYDTVFIGYPIWWGVAAWPVSSFVSENNFDGKTVIPFCTSASSSLGESGELLEDAAGSGTWQEGYRFSSSPREDDISGWLDSLNI